MRRALLHIHGALLTSFDEQAGTFPLPREVAPFVRFPLLLTICWLCAGLSQAGCGHASQAHPPRVSATKTNARPERDRAPSSIVVNSVDADADGIPDRAELRSFSDRENFRHWFTGIAEMQFYEMSRAWNVEQRDCAGLVRFSWREALRTHDRQWLWRMNGDYASFAPDVRAYTLDKSPLGERLFRTKFGAFRESDLADDSFSEFADARTLKDFNTEFVGRDRRAAEPGDLLFFHQPWAQKFPYHVMIFLGAAREEPENATDWVVYHTGAMATDKGTIRKVRLAVLDHHPDKRWRPVEHNRNFLGFYRLKILR